MQADMLFSFKGITMTYRSGGVAGALIASFFLTVLAMSAVQGAQAQGGNPLIEASVGQPVVWRATVSGDLNLQLGGTGRVHKVRTSSGGHLFALHLADEARQLHQPLGAGVLLTGLFAQDPEGESLPLDLGPFEDIHVPGRGRLALEVAGGEHSGVSASSGAIQVSSFHDGFEASFSAVLEQAGTGRAFRTIESAAIEGHVCQVAEANAGLPWDQVDCHEPTESPADVHVPVATGRLYVDGELEMEFRTLACRPYVGSDRQRPLLHGIERDGYDDAAQIFVRRFDGPEGLIEEFEFGDRYETFSARHVERGGAWFDAQGNPADPVMAFRGGQATAYIQIVDPEDGSLMEVEIEADCP